MKCPLDQTELAMTERQGIEIDYCPKCRGVSLDRSEFDKIIERSSADAPMHERREHDDHERAEHYDHEHRRDHGRDRKRRRESFLSDLFDF